MKKFVTNDKWTGVDKNKHFAGGLVIALVGGMVFSPVVGLVAGAVVAGIKEIYDAVSEKGTPSLQDFVVTVLGSAIGSLIVRSTL